MAEWRKFANKQKEKRTAKANKAKKENKDERAEIIVQRMSSDVSDKQQKYTLIGPREYGYEEPSFENIVAACPKHFDKRIESDKVCNILASERGPSCSKMSQIPDQKVFYVRLIKSDVTTVEDDEDVEETDIVKPQIKKQRMCTRSVPSPTKRNANNQSFYPKSLSVRDMVRLGNPLKKKTEAIQIFTFNLHDMEWATTSNHAEFIISESPFAVGGFREAFKATSITQGYNQCTWVIKKYTQKTKEIIDEDLQQTVESHTEQSVQMHFLARNLASQLREKTEKEKLDEFGESFTFNEVFLGKMSNGEVTVEEFIQRDFIKYVNNTGERCVEDNLIADKAEAFYHYSYQKSEGKLMVVDIQGSDYVLYDPEIASKEAYDEKGDHLFCSGNLSDKATDGFFKFHNCNKFCKLLKLTCRLQSKSK